MMRFILVVVIWVIQASLNTASSQNTRTTCYNTIGWYNYVGTFRVSEKLSFHSEYQFRRSRLITAWQQSLLRIGVNYQLTPKVQLRTGYVWMETFPYGDIPINAMGREFTEHQTFQMVSISDKVSIVELLHRVMLEQRWVGRYSSTSITKEDMYPFMNRIRHLLRLQVPLKGKEITDKTPYAAAYDETFIGFGKNVGENVFDQNHFGVLFGYKLNSLFRFEAGYLSQIVQLGRKVDNRAVFQYNNGLILNANFNFDLRKKE